MKELTLSTSDPGAAVVDNKLSVQATEQRQVVLYTVTDPDKNTARAAVIVPPANGGDPRLDEAKLPLKIEGGKLLTIPVRDHVIVQPGKQALLTFATKVKAGPGADPGTESVKDATTLQYRSTLDFAGMTSVTFEVTDGTAPDDQKGRVATLSIPILVTPAPDTKHQPVFRPSDVSAAAGEGSTTVDLKQMVTDEDPGDEAKLDFTLGASSPNVQVKLDGSKLIVTAPVDAKPGSTGEAAITVTDGSTEPVSGQMLIKVTASTRPKMVLRPASITDAKAGQPSTIDLSTYITNPFAPEGKPVTIVGTPSATPDNGARISMSGLRLTITPPSNYHGVIVVSYLAQDATGQASRQAQGTVQVTVRDRPDVPTAVTAETHMSRTATVSWTAGANNGAPITNFTVRWTGDNGSTGSRSCGQVTTCTITGLTNAITYTFTVVATNEVADSDPSAPSNKVKPDVKPNPPGTPVGTFGDQQVGLTWAAATSDGSPVTSYTVEVSPSAGGTTQQTVTGTSMTWNGLNNGTAYTFRVRANSDFPDPSDWSGNSAAVVPAGPPLRPAAPNVAKDPASNLTPSATVTWAAPNGNGDSNMTYTLRRSGGAVVYSGTGRSASVTMTVSTSDQTFEVQATNKAGASQWSPVSNGVRAFRTPGAVSGLSVTPTGSNNQVSISFNEAAGNGALPSEMTYYWSANGVTQSISSGGGTVTSSGAFPNGSNVSVAVYAVSRVNGESVQGASTSANVNAYGPPTSPSISCSGGSGSISCSWSGGSDGGRTTAYTLSGGASGSVDASGNRTVGGLGYSQTVQVCIRATQNGTGLSDSANCASATTDPRPVPQPSVTISKGGSAVGQPGCGDASCAFIIVTTANFSSNPTCRLYWPDLWRTWTQGANQTRNTGSYYGFPGNTITVNCDGVSGSITW